LKIDVRKRIGTRVARRHATAPIGTFRVDFLELGKDALWPPAQSERNVNHVHSKVTHHADFTAELRLPFPVDRLGGIEVARMPKTGVNLQQLAELARARRLQSALCPRQKRKFRTATNESLRLRCSVADRLSGFQ